MQIFKIESSLIFSIIFDILLTSPERLIFQFLKNVNYTIASTLVLAIV